MTVVRLVAGVAGRRYRDDINHLSIFRRPLVKIDHCKEIRCDLSLVLRPDIKNFFFSRAMVVLVSRIAMVVSPTAIIVLLSAAVVLPTIMVVFPATLTVFGQRDGGFAEHYSGWMEQCRFMETGASSRECRVYQKHIFEGHQTMTANSPCSRLISERSL